MNVRELRIGNWVKSLSPKYHKEYIQIAKIDNEDCYPMLNNSDDIIHFEPIPITAELFCKCGFKVKRHKKYNDIIAEHENLANFTVIQDPKYYDSDDYFFVFNNDPGGYSYVIGKGMKYLHEVQNMFFALTGEDLQIELKV